MTRRRDWRLALAGLVGLLALLAGHLAAPDLTRRLDEAVFDLAQRLAPRVRAAEAPVRVIDIDGAALARYGQWPWPRPWLAELTRRLSEAGVAVIAFDIVFAEADRTSPARVVEDWRRFAPPGQPQLILPDLPDHDSVFAAALAAAPTVLGIILTPEAGGDEARPKTGIPAAGRVAPALDGFGGQVGNLPALTGAATGIGFISLGQGQHGVIRRAPMLAAVGETLWPGLAIEALRVAQGGRGLALKTTAASGESGPGPVVPVALKVGSLILPLDPDGSLRIRYAAPDPGRVLSATRILEGDRLDPALGAELRGRIVLIGTSAPGLRDLVATPMAALEPGVLVHAEIIEQIMAGEFLTRPDWALGAERLAMLLAGLAMILAMARGAVWPAFAAAGAGLAVVTGGCLYAFAAHALLFSPVLPVGGPTLLLGGLSILRFVRAEGARREIRRQFAHFLAPEVIDEIARNPGAHLSPGGESRILTVMFTDVRKFSTLTETMTPEEVVAFVNDLLSPLSDVILDHGGTIDKYIGDAIMAFWNAPRAVPDHAARAVRAMLAMQGALATANARLRAEGRPEAQIGVGVNSGACSVGNMGSKRRLGYTCVGDPVNLASRLEGLTKLYGLFGLIGSATAAALPDFALIEIDRVGVVGRAAPEVIHTVAGGPEARDAAFQALADAMDRFRDAYRAQDWAGAEAALDTVAGLDAGAVQGAPLAAALRTRVARLRADPPGPGWDGVWRAEGK